MDNPAAPADSLNVEQLLHLHTLTKDVAKVCQKQLRGYLDTLALLFRPRRILGDAIEGAERETVGGSDRNVAELRELYRKVALRPAIATDAPCSAMASPMARPRPRPPPVTSTRR